jgi:hypothetical protein
MREWRRFFVGERGKRSTDLEWRCKEERHIPLLEYKDQATMRIYHRVRALILLAEEQLSECVESRSIHETNAKIRGTGEQVEMYEVVSRK